MADRYSAAEQAKEMLQGSLDMPSKAQVGAGAGLGHQLGCQRTRRCLCGHVS